jgi:uncharacterized protein (DUF58 family)
MNQNQSNQPAEVPRGRSLVSKLVALANTDFCPSFNVYVYWLKQPVGWFVVALVCSILIGAFFSPIGWAIAAGLSAILLLGLGFPWLATRLLRCELRCETNELHEGDHANLVLKVRNPLPLPVLGLVVEDYFQTAVPAGHTVESDQSRFECGLAKVPAFSSAEYLLPIQPEYRGSYPNGEPSIACGFPFGIYTARKSVGTVAPVLVRPLLLPIVGECEFTGNKMAEVGDGNRPSHHGDFLGVREFQRGDSLRSIHWVQSARLDSLVVCERGGPQKSPINLSLSTVRCAGSALEARENLAWRVRIVATLVDLLSARHIPIQLWIDDELKPLPNGKATAKAAWDHLASIPLDSVKETIGTADASSDSGFLAKSSTPVARRSPGFTIFPLLDGRSNSERYICVDMEFGEDSPAAFGNDGCLIDLDVAIDEQLDQLLAEVTRDHAA